MPEYQEIYHSIRRTADLAGLLRLKKTHDLTKAWVVIDLGSFTFFDPLHVTLLAQHIILLVQDQVPRISFLNLPPYLDQIGFLEFCNLNQEIPFTIDKIPSSTAMPLMRLSTSTMSDYITKAINYIRGFCPGKDLSMLATGVSELINNVYDHSKSPIGAYISGQFFPTKRHQVSS